jgi:sarcosine oxidase
MPTSRPRDYDVVVLGLGGMGSAAAAELAARGAQVLGIEQFGPAHALGSSHGETRIVRMAYFEKPDYVPLLRRAYEQWDALAAAAGEPILVRTGALMIGAPDSAVVAGTLASVGEWELPHEVLDRDAMAVRYPQFRLREGEIAVREENAGYVSPERSVRAQLDRAQAAGAELRFDTAAQGWSVDPAGVRVQVDGTEVRAAKLVIAAGAWTSRLVPDLGVPLRVGRRVMHYWTPRVPIAEFAPERFPVYIFQTDPGDEIYGFPLVGDPAGGVKLGFHHRGADCDPDTVNREVAGDEVAEMRALLERRLPGLAGVPVRSKVCMYTLTPDEHFVIDHLPGTDRRVAVATGFSGHGFKFTPVVGEILADLVLDGGTRHPIGFLSLDRFAPAT